MSHSIDNLVDAPARRDIRSALDVSLIVEAAAGTGKTTELVARIIAVLRSGRGTLAEMVAVTFTEKAAGEMRLRLRAELEQVRTNPDVPAAERALLDAALGELEATRIGTIHALCADLLHERPVEAQVDPAFGLGSDGAFGSIFDRAFETWFQRILQDPPEGVRRILRRPRSGARDGGPKQTLRLAAWKLAENRDFQNLWTRPDVDRAAAIDEILPRLQGLAERHNVAFESDDYLARNLNEIRRFCDELEARERGSTEQGGAEGFQRDYDGLEAQLGRLVRDRSWRWVGRGRYFGQGLLRDEVVNERNAVKAHLDELMESLQADLAACLRADLGAVVTQYEHFKGRAGELDFLDLLIRTRDLVRDDAGVRQQLQRRFTHIFVDEFQDTDPLQAEILLLLASDDTAQSDWRAARPTPGKLFVVGDPKQSIYRFRRADVALYEAAKQRLMGHGVRLLHLSTSFRSRPAIQECVNVSFASHMTGGPSQAQYVALQPSRPAQTGRPSVVALPVPKPYSDYGKVTNWAVDKSLPSAVGAYVQWLVKNSGWTVEEGGAEVAIAPRHICLLFRRFQSFGRDVTRDYVAHLEQGGIPHVLVGGHGFHGRDEVLAVRNALTAIEWPTDQLSVFATLRGPLFAVGDDALMAYSDHHRTLNPLAVRARAASEDEAKDIEAIDDDSQLLFDEVDGALEVLARLHHARNRRPVADTISDLLESTRAHAGLAVWPSGEQALANVLRVTDLARRFEVNGATSFRSFVEQLQRQAERGDTADAPIVEEGTEGVRIMTVHRAKGLEFPVVVLCDPTAPRTYQRPSLFVDATTGVWASTLAGCAPAELLKHGDESLRRDGEEGIRLAYVAATRARDLLVVPACGDERLKGWLDPLNMGVYPPIPAWRTAQAAVGCPAFGPDSVAKRPSRARMNANSSVQPGAHQITDGLAVTWWDPTALPPATGGQHGLRHPRILEVDDAGVAEASIRGHAAWETARAETIARGSVRSFETISPTALAHPVEPDASPPAQAVAAVTGDWLAEVGVESTAMQREG
ncbi:MAG: ATP-dependent helicase/nuclease subunit A, partial [Myxococcota bacterium]